jgi:hypothetical protein
MDLNANGILDPGEGLANVTLQLSGTVTRTVMTDATGSYLVGGLPLGSYQICAATPTGATLVSPPGGCYTGLDVLVGGTAYWYMDFTYKP